MKKKALIIGISGQDGAYLASLLILKGYDVFGSSRDHENCKFSNLHKLNIYQQIRLISLSVNDFRSVVAGIENTHPDEIYNLGGQTSVGLSFQYPIETIESIAVGALNILEAIKLLDPKIKYYNAGSSECYGNTEKPANESTLFRPCSPYAVAKATAHYYVALYRNAYQLFASTGVLFNHESPLRSPRFVTKKIVSSAKRISDGLKEKLLLGRLDVIRDWGWAPEYAEAMWRIMQHTHADDFVVATGTSYVLEEFVSQVFQHYNLKWQDYVTVQKELFRPSDIYQSFADPSKANQILKWSAKTNFRNLIKKLCEAELATCSK